MYTQSNKRKASKGSVQIKTSNGRLQLVFSYGGKRHYLSLGFDDTPQDRKLAEMKAREIELDMLSGHFTGVDKYKPQSAFSTIDPVTPIFTPKSNLDELWEKYVEFKRPQVSQTTIARDYKKYRSHISRLPSTSLDDAVQIRDWLLANLTPNAAKRCLTNISACCDWAMKSGLVDANPFWGMAVEVKLSKGPESEATDIHSFTRKEREKIIQAFKSNRYYSHYASLIEFLFFTGCRPSEAIALQWKHINDKFITIEQAITYSETGLAKKSGLKTQERRRFPINGQLRSLLNLIKPEDCSPDDYLFPSPEGKFIDLNNFRNRAWKAILESLPGIEYRKLYQTRHTFITLCLEADIDAKDVARWVGNSPEVIYRHYAGNKRDLQVPEL